MLRLAERVVAEGLSVRATEELATRGLDRAPSRRRSAPTPDVRLDEIASRLSDQFAARVRISVGQRRGRIAIEFATPDDLDRILAALTPAG
jgi:ParB family chromosome partitioning protein